MIPPLAVARTRPLFPRSVTPCPLLPSSWTITVLSKLGTLIGFVYREGSGALKNAEG